MITVSRVFPIGIATGEGELRKCNFRLRCATVRDSVEAVEELGPDASTSRMRYAIMARRLEVEGIEAVTTDMVMDLCERDGMALEVAAEELEGKLDAWSNASSPTD